MAFVSSFTPCGLGTPVSLPSTSPRTPGHAATTMAAKFGIQLDKYAEMSKDGPASPYYSPSDETEDKPTYDGGALPDESAYAVRMDKYAAMSATGPAMAYPGMATVIPSTPSSGWTSYAGTMMSKIAPTVTKVFREVGEDAFCDYMDNMVAMARPVPKAKGSPDVCTPSVAADKYVAQCLTAQYKTLANPMGVYSPSCTEGASKLQAEESRELSNMASFRALQTDVAKKFGSYTEARRAAFTLAKGCSYEESLVAKFPTASAAMLRGYSEAKVCVPFRPFWG